MRRKIQANQECGEEGCFSVKPDRAWAQYAGIESCGADAAMVAGFVGVSKPARKAADWREEARVGQDCVVPAWRRVGHCTMFGGNASSVGSRRLEAVGCSCPWLKVGTLCGAQGPPRNSSGLACEVGVGNGKVAKPTPLDCRTKPVLQKAMLAMVGESAFPFKGGGG